MTTIVEFTLPPDGFPLGTVFADLPDVTIQLERLVPAQAGHIPYFWVRGTETDTILEKFSSHPGVTDIKLVDSVGDEYLLRCKWVADHKTILDALVDPEVIILSAVGTAAEWRFKIRGESGKSIAAFRQYCHEHEIPIAVREIHALKPFDEQHSLTKKQRDALVLAFEHGYFDSPRETALEEIAEELGISRQALSSRLQRGTRKLIQQLVVGSVNPGEMDAK